MQGGALGGPASGQVSRTEAGPRIGALTLGLLVQRDLLPGAKGMPAHTLVTWSKLLASCSSVSSVDAESDFLKASSFCFMLNHSGPQPRTRVLCPVVHLARRVELLGSLRGRQHSARSGCVPATSPIVSLLPRTQDGAQQEIHTTHVSDCARLEQRPVIMGVTSCTATTHLKRPAFIDP